MDVYEMIRNADSAADVLSALSVYVQSLGDTTAIPDWCLRLPLDGAADVYHRMVALVAAVNLASQNLRDRDCNLAKQALRVFAAAAWRLRRQRPGDS
jgi:hypothetical protein